MKNKYFASFNSWTEAESAWDKRAELLEKSHPLKNLKTLPNMPGMTEETKKNLKLKSLLWMIKHDSGFKVMRYILKRPFRHLFRYVQSIVKGKPYTRDDDFFYYGIQDDNEFKKLLQDEKSHFVVGFSYCEKPLECPSGRFTDQCIHDPDHPVCGQCFIGKAVHTVDEKKTTVLFIPTIHYIAEKIFATMEENPGKQIVFMITACEMTLEMFGDWGNMANIRGIGVRLDGRICNTMRAFELSEKGVKPGLTVVLDKTKKRMLKILRWSVQ